MVRVALGVSNTHRNDSHETRIPHERNPLGRRSKCQRNQGGPRESACDRRSVHCNNNVAINPTRQRSELGQVR